MCECGHECGFELLEMEVVMQNNIQLHRKDKCAQDGQRFPAISSQQKIFDTQRKLRPFLGQMSTASWYGDFRDNALRRDHVLRGVLADGIEVTTAQHLSRVETEVFVRIASAKFQHVFDIPLVRIHYRQRRSCSVTDTCRRRLCGSEVGKMLKALARSSLSRVIGNRAHRVPDLVSDWPIPTRWGDVRLQKLIQQLLGLPL